MSAASPVDPNTVPAPVAVARPTVLSLAIKEKAALYAAYMPFLKNGGMFVPTNKPYKIGDESDVVRQQLLNDAKGIFGLERYIDLLDNADLVRLGGIIKRLATLKKEHIDGRDES